MIEFIDVSKQYDAIKAVDAFSARIQNGQICGFLGPNGAGKTTSIRMLMNIIHPDSGSILFDGDISRPESHHFGYLPEERGLYQKISLIETLQYFAHLRNVKDAAKKIKTYLDRFDLGARMHSRVSELSKGNQQKLQFINTILHDPEYVVLDEPFSGLDPLNQILLKEILVDMRAAGKTIIFSSHQMDQVEKVCDEVVLIDDGKLVLSGNLSEIKKNHGKRQLEVLPEDILDLKDDYFKQKNAEIRMGAAYIDIDGHSKKDLIAEINSKFNLRSIRDAEYGLEEIFIQLLQDH